MTSTKPILRIFEAEVLQRQATHLIGTLGHVAEGKSTLIRSLTGVKTQRHQKEQERNITIHLGYANCKVWQNQETGELTVTNLSQAPLEEPWTLIAHLSFVDCPGHEAYLATMLGGSSIMDTACLIVAANESVIPQPQTYEHLIAAELMGLNRIAVIQNKLDLISTADALVARDKIRTFTTDTVAGSAPLLPISAQHGWGVNRVLDFITGLAPPPRDLTAPARLTCVRSFDVNKPVQFVPGRTHLNGAVIGGTLEQGVLAEGDWIEIRPGVLRRGANGIAVQPIISRVRGIRCEATSLPYAVPGSLIAIATDLDPGLSIANGMVGQRIGMPGTLPPIAKELVLKFRRLQRDTHSFEKHRVGDRVRVCSNVMTTEGKITGIDERKRVTIQLDRPLCVGLGERVSVLRHHQEAGRELLEGTAEVFRLTQWPEILSAEGQELATPPDREVEWVPVEKTTFDRPPMPSYEELLDAVMSCKSVASGGGKSGGGLGLPEPEIKKMPERRPIYTYWLNWKDTVEVLDAGQFGDIPYASHLQMFLETELTTTSNLNGQDQLIIRGVYRNEDLASVLRKYIGLYKRCGQCRGYKTGIIKAGRVEKLRCTHCSTESVIDA